jgi:hypothetical protein
MRVVNRCLSGFWDVLEALNATTAFEIAREITSSTILHNEEDEALNLEDVDKPCDVLVLELLKDADF